MTPNQSAKYERICYMCCTSLHTVNRSGSAVLNPLRRLTKLEVCETRMVGCVGMGLLHGVHVLKNFRRRVKVQRLGVGTKTAARLCT